MNRATAKITAIVAMKGHSARAGKHQPLCGRPLFHWIVDTLVRVPEIDQVVIETRTPTASPKTPRGIFRLRSCAA